MTQNTRSDTVLDRGLILEAEGTSGSEAKGASRTTQVGASAPPPPPPPPAAGNLDPKAIKDQIRAHQRQLREAKRSAWSGKVKHVNRQYWWYLAAIVAMSGGVLGCRSMLAFQRDTAVALAEAKNPTTDTTAAPVVVDGLPNPLEQMHLTPQARWLIGIDKDGALLPNRSATVLVQMLAKVNPCSLFIGMDAKSTPIITATPTPGFTTLSDCPASSTTLPAATVSGS